MALLKQSVSIRTILPNLVTMCAFASGLTAMRFAMDGRFEAALAALALAGVLDGLDGTVARLLNSASRFGAELDSLSDVVAFGAAPALTIYLWALEPLGRIGWAGAMIFAVAMALRLARFNSRLDDEGDMNKRLGFLTGVPAPIGCALAVLPIMLTLAWPSLELQNYPLYVGIYMMLVGIMLVSTLPTPSLKQLRVKRSTFPVVMLVMAAIFGGLFAKPWMMLVILSGLYVLSLPICFIVFRRRAAMKGWV